MTVPVTPPLPKCRNYNKSTHSPEIEIRSVKELRSNN